MVLRHSLVVLSTGLLALLAQPVTAQYFAYVSNINSATVSVIETDTDTVFATVNVGEAYALLRRRSGRRVRLF